MGFEPPPKALQSPVVPPAPPPPPSSSPAPESTSATSLAPGFRFHPTDQELVSYYLKRKVCGKPIRFNAISETDIYKSEPWDLPALSRLKSRDNEWYFFGVQDKKYVSGSRVNRATGEGYWKATGNDRPIVHNNRTVAMKKTLVFYSGRAPCGERTNWVMHEYRLTDEELAKDGISLDSYLLCKILKKSGPGFKPGEQYGPFMEEEWDREDSVLVPGEEAEDGSVGNVDSLVEDSVHSINTSEGPPAPCPSADKKLSCEPNSSHSNALEISTMTTNGPCSSSSGTTTTTTNLSPALLELPLLEPPEPKEGPTPVNMMDMSVPPSCLRLFEELRNEIYRISFEKESLKIEEMSARTMISILHSKIDHLTKENEDLKTTTRPREG